MKAVLHYTASAALRARLAELSPPWLDLVVVPPTDAVTRAAEMRDAEVLLHVLVPRVSAELMALAPRLRLIQKLGVGVDTIDVTSAKVRGIAVANTPGRNSQAVAELTLGLMLATLRKLVVLDRSMRTPLDAATLASTLDGVGEIAGRTVGLVGFGEIPRRLAPVLSALGANVIYHDRKSADGIAGWRSLDALFAEADIVSLHIPLLPETAGIVSSARLRSMRRGAILINTARGGLVDEIALEQALREGRLAAAGLDVFGDEPTPSSHPLLALDNVVATPHVAWQTPETLERSIRAAITNCQRLHDGEPLADLV
jgi:phosphoglycerate dehydrogenase-like enzyme